MDTKRIYFIDIVRAFAILMMLQGHFIDTFLANSFRNTEAIPFVIWRYLRGITAPVFFTISGLIFTYLLLKAQEKRQQLVRIKKGIIRSFFLILIGYLLRIPIIDLFLLKIYPNYLVVDVLQCIGIGLLLIIVVFCFFSKKSTFFSGVLLLLGTLIFLTEPLYRKLSLENVPIFLSNYISKNNGSIFTILPWFGYISFGAFVANLFFKYVHLKKFKPIIITLFFTIGIVLVFYSSTILMFAYNISGIQLFYACAHYNYLFSRLGNVLLYFGLFYTLENYLKLKLILKIGQKTLSIYVIHFIIIYGSFTGIGLKVIGKILTPLQAVFGAIGFIICVCLISFYYAKTNAFVYKKLRNFYFKIKKEVA